jgi:hypothetical protein
MYHKVGIQKLSPTQISKLLNGHKIRVKHGQGLEIHASQEQHKKIMSAHKKGKAHTMQFDPYQIAQHQHLRKGGAKKGGAWYDDLANTLIEPVKSIGKAVAKPYEALGVNPFEMGYNLGHDVIAPAIVGRGRGRPRILPYPQPMMQEDSSSDEGMGIRGRASRRGKGASRGRATAGRARGRGIIQDAEKLANKIVHSAPVKAVRKIAGVGVHHHHHHKKVHHGQALYPAGYGMTPAVMPMGAGLMAGAGASRGRAGRRGKGFIGSTLGSLAGNFLPF